MGTAPPSKSEGIGIRAAFRASMLAVTLIAFAIAAVINFIVVTTAEHAKAENSVRSEVNYLCLQIGDFNEREAVRADAGAGGASSRVGDILNGYTMQETGTVILARDGKVIASDDGRIAAGSDIGALLEADAIEAIGASLADSGLQRIDCAGALAKPDPAGVYSQNEIGAYLMAGHQDGYDVVIIEPSSMVYRDWPSIMLYESFVALVILAAMFILISAMLSHTVARRVDAANEALERITAGDLDTRLEVSGTREFRTLSGGINRTVGALQGLITQAEERMNSELEAARVIQESALQRAFPPYPDIPRFDIYASMQAAKQVGGDFYDFFLVGDCAATSGKLAFVIADVSGKGVPAALFMMKAKTQIRDYLEAGIEVGEAVTEANAKLMEGNEAGTFVTAWVGVLDYGTGCVSYVNAGHNPPLLWQRDGGWRWLKQRSGPMLGLFDRTYKAQTVQCKPGDTFLLYTDGVTEAWNAQEEEYGEERLMEVAEEGYRLHPRELLESVRDGVQSWAGGAERSDDITLLTLEVGVPPEITAMLEVPAELPQLGAVNDFLHAELGLRLCPNRIRNQLDIAVEELFANVCNYAYADGGGVGTVRVLRTYSADPASITVELHDKGAPFNPLEHEDPVRPASIEEMPIGGLGIMLARKCVDELRYERIDGCNVVTIVKRW